MSWVGGKKALRDQILPYDTTHLEIISGMDHCTLVTCTPFGVNTHRLLVRGIRIPYEQAQIIVEEILAEEMPESTWEQEYKNSICITTAVVVMVGLAVLAVWLYRRFRHGRMA
jgi:sortase A